MKFYNITELKEGKVAVAGGIDMMRMGKAFEVLDKKSELKTLDNVMDYPFVFLNETTEFMDKKEFTFVESSKKLNFALIKEGQSFQLKDKKSNQVYFCAIHEEKLIAYLDEAQLKEVLNQKTMLATNDVDSRVIQWLETGRVGASSATLCATLFPHLTEHYRFDSMKNDDEQVEINWPHDNSDFVRCQKFLDAVPEAKARLFEMKKVSPEWSNLVDKWGEIEKLSEKAQNNTDKNMDKNTTGHEVYDLISQCVRLKKVKNTF